MPINADDRYLEVKMFVEVLADDLIDYDHLNVYNSVFRKRVDDYFEEIDFSMTEGFSAESIRLLTILKILGTKIRETETTKTRDFLAFYQAIIAFNESM